MSDIVTHAQSISVSNGLSLSTGGTIEVEATDKIVASIPSGSVETTLNVQPSLLSNLKAIMIKASSYANLTFKVDSEVTVHTLDAPLALIGAGNIALLGATVNDLKFTNSGTTAIQVEVLVARDAIPET